MGDGMVRTEWGAACSVMGENGRLRRSGICSGSCGLIWGGVLLLGVSWEYLIISFHVCSSVSRRVLGVFGAIFGIII